MPQSPLIPYRVAVVANATLAALALTLAGPALAEDAVAAPEAAAASDPLAAGQEQLDRIEAKLDTILRRLDSEAEAEGEAGIAEGEAHAPAPLPSTRAEPAGASAAAASAGSPPSPALAESYLPGAVALARAAPREARRLGEVPPDSVGGFVYEGGAIGLGDLSDRGVRYTGLAGVELQGWLRSTSTGRAQLAADLRVSFGKGALAEVPCLFEAWLEDQAIGSASQAVRPWDNRQGPAALSLVLGAELRPGLYKLRAWIACAAGSSAPPRVEAELLLKAPGELNLRPVTSEDLLRKPG